MVDAERSDQIKHFAEEEKTNSQRVQHQFLRLMLKEVIKALMKKR
ncbi:hypothetical protein ACEQPO_08505 [Bacillus sp. SL00103]